MKSFSMTDTGQVRNNNQDFVLCEENAVGCFPNLFIVADGMGGDVKMEKIRELLYCDLYLIARK